MAKRQTKLKEMGINLDLSKLVSNIIIKQLLSFPTVFSNNFSDEK